MKEVLESIDVNTIREHIKSVCLGWNLGNVPRLRKKEWVKDNTSVFKAMRELNKFFHGKYVLYRGEYFYDLHIEQREQERNGDKYYYQCITCKRSFEKLDGYTRL